MRRAGANVRALGRVEGWSQSRRMIASEAKAHPGTGAHTPRRRITSAVAGSVLLLGGLGALTASPAQAETAFTNYTIANGLGMNYVNGVYAIASTVYAATDNGLSISTDGGKPSPTEPWWTDSVPSRC